MEIRRTLIITIVFLSSFVVNSIYASETYLLKYNDGNVIELPNTEESSQSYEIKHFQQLNEELTVTLNATIFITDYATGKELTIVYPDQKVALEIYFNEPGSLEVPFEYLLGKTIRASFFLRGKLRYTYSWDEEILPIHEGLGGMGQIYVIPGNAESGEFIYWGKISISGVRCLNNRDVGIYEVGE